eukprot:7249963-Prymnesium_polylepis.1
MQTFPANRDERENEQRWRASLDLSGAPREREWSQQPIPCDAYRQQLKVSGRGWPPPCRHRPRRRSHRRSHRHSHRRSRRQTSLKSLTAAAAAYAGALPSAPTPWPLPVLPLALAPSSLRPHASLHRSRGHRLRGRWGQSTAAPQ